VRSSFETLMERVADGVGAATGVDELRRVVARAEVHAADDERVSLDDVERALSDLGLRARLQEGTVSELLASVGPEHPVIAFDLEGEWVVVVTRRGRSVMVETSDVAEPRSVSRDELAKRLAGDQRMAVRWLAVTPPSLLGRSTRGATIPDGEHPMSPWRRLRRLVIRERQDVVVAIIYAAGAGLFTLATPIAVQALVNTVAFGTLLQPVLVLTILLLAGLAFAGVLRALQAWVVEMLQRRVFLQLVDDLSHRLPRVPAAAFDRAHGPELVNRFFDIFTIQKAASSLLINGLEVVLTASVGMLVLAFYHPLLLAFDVVLLAIIAGILFGLGRGATHTAVAESKAKYEVASWLEEIARHPAAFKLAGGPGLARDRSDALAAEYLKRRQDHFRVVFRQLVGALSLHAFASAGILGIGGFLVIDRQLTLGQLVAAELIVTMVVASFAKIGKHLERTYDLLAALDKVGQLVDLPIEAAGSAVCTAESERGARVGVSGLSHGFAAGSPLLDDVSFELEPGDRVALRGRSGTGLSTLVDLLLGLRRADAGRVIIDGIHLDDLDREDLRSRVALVRGDEVVAGTIFDNIAFGRRDVDVTRARQALERVGLAEDVARLEGGIHTRLMPGGAPLSRGQALRLVLARAVVDDPSLLIVDGALDGLAPETREKAFDTLLAEDAPWTLLVVTNNDEVTSRMRRVLVVNDGKLVEREKVG
jgi:ABC-type bacteriocin/lantibiotic exporter with double-glycine peptidase domain